MSVSLQTIKLLTTISLTFNSVLSVVCTYATTNTTTANHNLNERERELARKQIMDTLDRLEKLIARIRVQPNRGNRQSGDGPFAVVSEAMSDLSNQFRRGLITVRYQFGRLMQSTPICNPLGTVASY